MTHLLLPMIFEVSLNFVRSVQIIHLLQEKRENTVNLMFGLYNNFAHFLLAMVVVQWE